MSIILLKWQPHLTVEDCESTHISFSQAQLADERVKKANNVGEELRTSYNRAVCVYGQQNYETKILKRKGSE